MTEKNLLVGLVGYPGAGKDTLADGLETLGWTRSAFADPMKEFLLRIDPHFEARCGTRTALETLEQWKRMKPGWHSGWWMHSSYNATREKLQNLGMLFREEVDENFWVNKALASRGPGNHVFTDVRFMNEAEAIMRAGGHIIAVERPGHSPVNEHASERGTTEVLKIAQGFVTNDGEPLDLVDAFVDAFVDLMECFG